MTKKRSLLTWLLVLPFRRGVRWLTLVVVLLAALAWWTGYLGHGARYVFWRYWPLDTPLVEYVDPALPDFFLVDASRPGARSLAPLAQIPWVKKRMMDLEEVLGIDAKMDLLQVLLTVDSQGQDLAIYRGRFRLSELQTRLAERGYRRGSGESESLFVGRDATEALLLDGSVLIHGHPQAVERAVERARQNTGLASDPRLKAVLSREGRRHALLGLSLGNSGKASLAQLKRGDGPTMESATLTLDPTESGQLTLDLCLTPTQRDQVTSLAKKIRGVTALLQGGVSKALPQSVATVVRDLRVDTDADSVHTWIEAEASTLASAIDDIAQPANALGLGLALAVGMEGASWLGQLGLQKPARNRGVPPTAPPAQGASRSSFPNMDRWMQLLSDGFKHSRSIQARPPTAPPTTAPASPPPTPSLTGSP